MPPEIPDDPFRALDGEPQPAREEPLELELAVGAEAWLDRVLERRLGILPRWRSLMLLATLAVAASCHYPRAIALAGAVANLFAGSPAAACSCASTSSPATSSIEISPWPSTADVLDDGVEL